MATFNTETKIWQGPKIPYVYPRDSSIGVELLKKLVETPQRILHVCHDDERSMSCEETRIASIRIAQNLTKLGYKQGDVVGFICRNSSYLPPALYGTLLIGAPLNPLDAGFKKDDVKHMFAQTSPKLVFCDSDVYETTKAALDELGNEAVIFTLLGKVDGVSFIEELLLSTGKEDSFVASCFGEAAKTLAVILCSSGITGSSKGVCLSHAHVLAYLKTMDQAQAFRSLSFSPIYWSTGLISTIMVAFRPNDTRVITAQSFSVDLLVHMIKKHDVNFFQAAPYQLTLLLQSPLLDPRDFIGIKIFYVLGSIVSEYLRKEFQAVFPRHPLIIAYGMSESFISISKTALNDRIDGLTVGHISANFRLKIIDDDGNLLGIGERGEILAKPEFGFMGYYNDLIASENAVDSDGFLKTGDIGSVDENGCIVIIDRKKAIMKYRGYQVNPSEIENIIASIEGVELVSVVGIPDPIATNLPAALVVKRPEFEDDLTEQFIMDYVAERLPEYKHLHGGAHFVDELPMTASGKIQKRFVKVIAIKEFNEKQMLENMMNTSLTGAEQSYDSNY